MSQNPEGIVFIDTNVLAYAHDTSEEAKQAIAKDLLYELWESERGAVSTQVLQEFYVVATRKFKAALSRKEAREIVSNYGEWRLVHIDLVLIINASKLEEQHQLSFWDALIVEAARRSGATRLLSEDLSSGSTIQGVAIENPFDFRPQNEGGSEPAVKKNRAPRKGPDSSVLGVG